jgi:hypothetical protein
LPADTQAQFRSIRNTPAMPRSTRKSIPKTHQGENMQLTRTVKLLSAALLALGAHAAQANKADDSLNAAFRRGGHATLDAYKESGRRRPGAGAQWSMIGSAAEKPWTPASSSRSHGRNGFKFVDDTTIELHDAPQGREVPRRLS